MKKLLITVAATALATLALTACKKQDDQMGPAQKVGAAIDKKMDQSKAKIDQAMDKASDKFDQAKQKMDQRLNAADGSDTNSTQ